MIKLFSLKQQKKDGESSPRPGNQKKASAAQLRITKGELILINIFFSNIILIFSDINELNLPKTCNTEFPDPDDLLNFKLIICPDEVRKLSKFLNKEHC